jgi:pyruvate dehydrogenase (quinone)
MAKVCALLAAIDESLSQPWPAPLNVLMNPPELIRPPLVGPKAVIGMVVETLVDISRPAR